MAIILLKFANKNGRFCLCASVKGTAIRHYRTITELVNPDYAEWDSKAQRFKSSSPNAAINNRTLAKIYRHYSCLLDEFEFKTGKELFEFQDKENEITLGEWGQQVILCLYKTIAPRSDVSDRRFLYA